MKLKAYLAKQSDKWEYFLEASRDSSELELHPFTPRHYVNNLVIFSNPVDEA